MLFGDRLTWPSSASGAVATKNIGCASNHVASPSLIPSRTFMCSSIYPLNYSRYRTPGRRQNTPTFRSHGRRTDPARRDLGPVSSRPHGNDRIRMALTHLRILGRWIEVQAVGGGGML